MKLHEQLTNSSSQNYILLSLISLLWNIRRTRKSLEGKAAKEEEEEKKGSTTQTPFVCCFLGSHLFSFFRGRFSMMSTMCNMKWKEWERKNNIKLHMLCSFYAIVVVVVVVSHKRNILDTWNQFLVVLTSAFDFKFFFFNPHYYDPTGGTSHEGEGSVKANAGSGTQKEKSIFNFYRNMINKVKDVVKWFQTTATLLKISMATQLWRTISLCWNPKRKVKEVKLGSK